MTAAKAPAKRARKATGRQASAEAQATTSYPEKWAAWSHEERVRAMIMQRSWPDGFTDTEKRQWGEAEAARKEELFDLAVKLNQEGNSDALDQLVAERVAALESRVRRISSAEAQASRMRGERNSILTDLQILGVRQAPLAKIINTTAMAVSFITDPFKGAERKR